MDRRHFLKLTPAAAGATATLTITEPGKEPIPDLDVGVLRLQPGDVLVLSVPGSITEETAARIGAYVEQALRPLNVTAWVLSDGMHAQGVLRTKP